MDVSTQLHEALNRRRLFIDAVRSSDLRAGEKLRLRLAYSIPSAREAINDFVVEKLMEKGDPATMADGTIIAIIIEYLPEILALIQIIIGLF